MEQILHKTMSFSPGGGATDKVIESRAGKEPEAYYLQPYRGIIHNQGYFYQKDDGTEFKVGSNSCVADTLSSILEKIEYYKGGEICPSVSMLYGSAGVGVDDGMVIVDASNSLKSHGALPFQYLKDTPHMKVYSDALDLSDVTYDGRNYKGARTVFNELYTSQKTNMAKTKTLGYSETAGKATSDSAIGTLQKAIKSTNQGVVFAYVIDKSFDEVDNTGVLKNADYKNSIRGSHVSFVVGWIHIDNVLHWIVQNSWGQYHADRGYIYMPYNWPGLTYYGIVTGTASPPATFTDIPKKANYTEADSSTTFTWSAIPNATSYEYMYRTEYYWYYSGATTSNQVKINTSDPLQFHYRAVYAGGVKGLWSNPVRVLSKINFKGISSVIKLATNGTYRFYLDIVPTCRFARTISVTDKSGKNIAYTLSSNYITVPIPPINDYYEVKVDISYLYEARLGSLSKTKRGYGALDWQYMKDDVSKEVKITAKEWNDCCSRIENLAKDVLDNSVSIPRVTSGQNISAKNFNDMLKALRTGFVVGSSKYIIASLIPTDVTNVMPITKQHFIKLRNAINSISI